MYSRNTAARRREQESCENCNHYRYSIPPRYDGSRFRHRDKGEVVALPDSAFSGLPEEREPPLPHPEPETVENVRENNISTNVSNEQAEEAHPPKEETASAVTREQGNSPMRLFEHMKSDDLMLIVIVFVLFLESGGENFDGELLFFLALLLGMGNSY